jgi:chromosome segregation ATPase
MPFAKVEDRVLATVEAELVSLEKDEALYSEKLHEIAAKITAMKADLGLMSRVGHLKKDITLGEEVKLQSELRDLYALEQRDDEHFRAKRDEVASKKTEIGNAERTVKMLKDEIKSLDGGQRAAIIFEANLKREEAKRIIEQADTMLPQLEATIANSYAQLKRLTGSTVLD